MKKFTKISLIISAIIVAIGIILCVTGGVMGVNFSSVFWKITANGINIRPNGVDIGFGKDNITLDKSLDSPLELKDNMSLEISTAGGDIDIVKSTDGKFSATAEGINMKWNVEDNKVILQAARNDDYSKSAGKVKVYVPEDYEFDNVEIDCGAGSMNTEFINAKDLELNLGAGELIADKINTEDLDVECGAGNITINGSVTGDCNIDCSMGNIKVNLDQKENYFTYNIDGFLGGTRVNGSSYYGLVFDKNIDNDNARSMDVSCAMGNVDITTK